MILCVMFQLVARCTWLCSSSTSQTSAAKMERKVGRNQCRYFISDWIVIKEIGRCWNVVTMSRRISYFYNQILFLCIKILYHYILPAFTYISKLACPYYLLYYCRLGAPVPVDDGERECDGGQGRCPHLPHLTQRGLQGDYSIV